MGGEAELRTFAEQSAEVRTNPVPHNTMIVLESEPQAMKLDVCPFVDLVHCGLINDVIGCKWGDETEFNDCLHGRTLLLLN